MKDSSMMNDTPAHRPRPAQVSHQSGVSMIEVLVALVIFAFGMLGLAGLQTRTLAFSQSSLYRSQATALADDILDRMRADRTNAKGGAWNTALTAKSSDVSGSEIYKTDLKDWKQQVESLLPSGAASVDVTADIVTVTLQWDDSRADSVGGDTTMQFVTKSRL